MLFWLKLSVLESALENYRGLMEDTREYQTAAAEEEAALSGSVQIPASRSTPRSIDHYTEDPTAASKELDAIMNYWDKLKPQFETQVTSIEE